MRVGFPWISLDSLVRIETYQWVTRDNRAKVFLDAFVPAGVRGARTGAPALRPCGRTGLLMGRVYCSFCFSATDCRSTLPLSDASIRKSIVNIPPVQWKWRQFQWPAEYLEGDRTIWSVLAYVLRLRNCLLYGTNKESGRFQQ
jgi:hypothetical protein